MDNLTSPNPEASQATRLGISNRLLLLAATGAVFLSLVALRSKSLTRVTITAIESGAEPKDHELPFFRKKEALPDYNVSVVKTNSDQIDLGSKPDQSAVSGLTWVLPDPVSVAQIASVRLDDKDKLISDAISEVQFTSETVTYGNYEFEFDTEISISAGLYAVFSDFFGRGVSVLLLFVIFLVILSAFNTSNLT